MSAESTTPANNLSFIDNPNTGETKDVLTFIIGGQRFGIPILQVQDVLGEQAVTNIPLAPKEVAGSLNLRGRVVTAIDLRLKLGIGEDMEGVSKNMSVVVEHEEELYSLIIDRVGDVLRLEDSTFEQNPATMVTQWKRVSLGIYRLERELLVVLDIPKLLDSVHS